MAKNSTILGLRNDIENELLKAGLPPQQAAQQATSQANKLSSQPSGSEHWVEVGNTVFKVRVK